jgi:hypothetical protein
MAGRLVKQISATITGVAAGANGYITVASTVGFYAGAKGSMNIGGAGVSVIITEVASATSLGVRIIPDDWFQPGAAGPNYGRSVTTAYNGGTITQYEQLIFNPNDAPLT